MVDWHVKNCVRRMAFVAALVGGLVCQAALAGEALKRLDVSLQWLPEDGAVYSAMLRNREQIEAIGRSRAWKSLIDLPAVKEGLKALRAQMEQNEKAAALRAALENPEVRRGLDLLADMFSREVFVYGEKDTVDFVYLMQQVTGATRYGPAFAQITGQARAAEGGKIQATLALSALAQNAERIKVPSMMLGFRVKDTALAREALIKLEAMLNVLSVALPQMADRVKRTRIGDHEYLTISLSGEMIPWQTIPIEELESIEARDGDARKVIDRIKKLTLVIALGLRNDYLLVAIGPSTGLLERLGKGKALVERPEFRPLEAYADRPLVGISYMNQQMAARLLGGRADMDDLVTALSQVLDNTELTADQKARIRKDLQALSKDIKQVMPEPGAQMQFNFLTDRGMEGYNYDWGTYPGTVGSKPLGLLSHVGGNPLLMAVARRDVSPRNYETIVRWVKVAYGYFETFVLPQMSDSERQDFDRVAEKVRPLLERFDRVNRTMLIPAISDGQVGMVVEAKLRSRQFIREMPRMEQPMPMVEPALLLGVSDSQLFCKAMAEYRQLFNAAVEIVREASSGEVPDIRIPEPQVTKTDVGTLYWYRLPEEWGVTEEVKVVLGVSDRAATISATSTQAERLLRSTPLAVGGVLASPERPLAGAFAMNWAAIVDAAAPWVEFGVAEAVKQSPRAGPANLLAPSESDSSKAKDMKPAKAAQQGKIPKGKPPGDKTQSALDPAAITHQVRTVLEALKALRSVTAESYPEAGATVTHSLVEIRDID